MGFLNDVVKDRKEIRKQNMKEYVLSKYNVFEGIKVEVTFPDKQLRINQHSGAVKAAATLGFGIVGLAAASGTKQEEKNRSLETEFRIVEKGIVFKQATMDSSDLRIPWDNIISSYTHIKIINQWKYYNIIITLLENQEIDINISMTGKDYRNGKIVSEIIGEHVVNIINERACGVNEAGWGLENEVEQIETEEQKSFSEADELDKWFSLYERGAISKEEFEAKKKQLLGL